MSTTVPVLFGCVDNTVSFPPGSTCGDAYDWPGLEALHEAGNLWWHWSRNWWHLFLTHELAEALDLNGLELLNEECVTISVEELGETIHAIESVLLHLRNREPRPEDVKDDWHYDRVTRPEHLAFLDEIEPSHNSNDHHDGDDRKIAASYYCFLKSLHAVATEALNSNRSLLWVQTQP